MKLIGNGFVSYLPGGWTDGSIITVIGPKGASGFAANIVITREEQAGTGMAIEEYVSRQRETMQDGLSSLEVLDERAGRVAGRPAYHRLQEFSDHGRSVKQAQTFVLGDGVIFAVTYTALPEDFERHAGAFRSAIESFRCFNPDTTAI